jgi:hypothetical protein
VERSFDFDYYNNDAYDMLFSSLSVGFILAYCVLIIALYCLSAFFLMKLFRKANVDAWKAWVPFVNTWAFLQLGGYQGWIALLPLASIIPCVGWIGSIVTTVFMCMAAYQIGLKLRKEGVMVLLYIFIGIVWEGICGLDSSVWDDSLGKPSLLPGVPSSGGYGGGYAASYTEVPYQQQNTPYQQQGTPYQQQGTPYQQQQQGAPYQPNAPYQQGGNPQNVPYPQGGSPQSAPYPQGTPNQPGANPLPPADGTPPPPNNPYPPQQ